ncbi:MAG: Na+:solute symporter, partial [Planctomycetia bacterium]|nr:Na+:solute symporter [Planctomycetia bacterium]
NDWYRRFWNPKASEKQLVFAGRLWTVLLMVLAAVFSFFLKNALQAFQILMLIGAGTGLLFLLRWFWWRINAWSEISAMVISFGIALYFKFVHTPLWITVAADGTRSPEWLDFSDSMQLIISVIVTTVGWVVVTFLTKPTDEATLREFVRRSRAGGPGWKRIVNKAKSDGVTLEDENVKWSVPIGILCTLFSCIGIYGALFATGAFLYGNYIMGSVLSVLFVVGMLAVIPLWKRLV